MKRHDPLHLKCPAFMELIKPETAAKITKAGALISYTNGQLIHSRGDNKPGLSIIAYGTVFAGITDSEGKQLIVGILGEGHCFGEFTLFTDLVRTHDVTSVGETKVLQISNPLFMALFDDCPDIAKAMLKSTLYRLHIVLESMDALRRLPVLERTAKILLIFSYSTHQDSKLPVKQEELANTLGVSRVTMGKTLKKLADSHLISLGYGVIYVKNRAALVDWLLVRSKGIALT